MQNDGQKSAGKNTTFQYEMQIASSVLFSVVQIKLSKLIEYFWSLISWILTSIQIIYGFEKV